MVLKLYCDLMSQPSRALYILLKSVKCDFEPRFVDLRKAEHYSEEYTKINRFQRVPVIDHDGFLLTESVAILKYLARENIIPDALYPRESKLQARVEEFLEYQHAGLRLHCAMYFRVIYMNPILTGSPTDPKSAVGYKKRMISSLEDFNTKWLGRGTDFIVGNKITVADLIAACELEQPRMAGYFPEENFQNIEIWWKKVRDYFNPHYDEAHVILTKIVNKQKKTVSKI
ncbi:hypothetical protein K1T71_007638 [Dendrolimus kikuchii]|uniref:Uncharacterized protein n=1 Tax=Dendrolimus kikuchii TaxID=765133 RepID=A0ACC1CXK7_9NEOP|nr:hypothetical protein K1T71_007638 [Dendrolimus kikuchii]